MLDGSTASRDAGQRSELLCRKYPVPGEMSPSKGGDIRGESGEGDREIWGPYQESQLAGAGEGLHATVHLELSVQLLQVPLDGAGRHDQFMGNLHIRLASGQQAQHSQFALFEGLDQRRVSELRWALPPPTGCQVRVSHRTRPAGARDRPSSSAAQRGDG